MVLVSGWGGGGGR
ncbi:hypothetical protein A2U01_0114521, partial [Trifolium medium]|nr:hypothetical protein [Trifolium medium]